MLRLSTHLENPQARHITRGVLSMRQGGLVVYPTDTTYGLGCDLFAKRTIERIYQIKGLPTKHPLSFLCPDLSDVARYAIVSNSMYRLLKHHVPGPYTFVLPASKEVPKLVQSQQKTVGIRIPKSPVCQALLAELGHPIISTTVGRTAEEALEWINDPDTIAADFGRSIDVLLDGGPLFGQPSTVLDLTGDVPKVLRQGAGDIAPDWLLA